MSRRSYTAVMRDLAVIGQEFDGGYFGVNDDNAGEMIRELAALPVRRYRHALETLRTMGRIYQIGTKFLRASR